MNYVTRKYKLIILKLACGSMFFGNVIFTFQKTHESIFKWLLIKIPSFFLIIPSIWGKGKSNEKKLIKSFIRKRTYGASKS